MAKTSEVVCFTCGQDVGEPPRMNRLEDGAPCRACGERVLEALPPLLPFQGDPAAGVEQGLERHSSQPAAEEQSGGGYEFGDDDERPRGA